MPSKSASDFDSPQRNFFHLTLPIPTTKPAATRQPILPPGCRCGLPMKVFISKSDGFTDASYVFPFVRALLTYLRRERIEVTARPNTGETIALGVQWDPPLDIVRNLTQRRIPFIHRLDGRARSVVKVYDKDDENRQINRLASWTIFQSEYVRQHTTKPVETIFGPEAPICTRPDRGSIIYNGVDRAIFREDGPRERLKGEFTILHIAFTHGIRKGVGDLINIATLLRDNPRIHFYTIGRQTDDIIHGHLLASLPNVTHLGVIVDRERMATLMRSAHALFFPSRDDYCPNTVLEAMSCGLPVWYHPSGGTPELVRTNDLVAGVPMMEQNPIYPLHALREHDAELSRRAVEMIEQRFTLEHMGRAYLELFRSLVEEHAHAAA